MKYTKTTLTKLLTASIMLMWIQKVSPCLVLYPVDKIIKFEEMKKLLKKQEEKIKQFNDKRKALYLEEQNLLQKEPDYFPEDNIDFDDFAEILPEEFSHSENGENITNEYAPDETQDDGDYPEFPTTKDDNDYDYSEFEMVKQELTDVDETEEYEDEKYEDYYGEFFPNEKRNKRDAGEVIDGLVESGEKLLSGNLVGGVTTFVKSLAKPIFSYFIHSNNDHAMQKFTNRLLPETKFKDTAGAHIIRKAANEGDGERVWHQLSNQPSYWNPRSNFIQDKYHKSKTHIECRRNVPIIDRNLVHRLKSVSLMMTSLMTSLHDTTIADLNQGFKKATEHFSNIHKTTGRILNHTIYKPEIDLIIDILKDTAVIVELIQEDMADKTDEFVELALIGVGILGVFLLGVVLASHIKRNNHETEAIRGELAELKRLISPADVRETEEDKTRRTVVAAVREAMDVVAGQMLVHQPHMDPLTPAMLQVGNRAVRQSSGSAAHPRGVALTYQQ